MNWHQLAGPLIDAGFGMLGAAIGGPAGGAIGAAVGRQVGAALGVDTPEAAVERIETDPKSLETLQRLETERFDEWAALARAQQEMQAKISARDASEGGFDYRWRPGGMWLILYFWLQNCTVFPVVGLPLIPWEILLGFTALFSGLYMGGHTAKQIFGNRFATRG